MQSRKYPYFEPLSKEIAQKIAEAGWPAISGEIDVEFGCVAVGHNSKSVWTTEGKRIDISLDAGTFIIAVSHKVDPVYLEIKNSLKKKVK